VPGLDGLKEDYLEVILYWMPIRVLQVITCNKKG